jgi:outer membrane cobalamin receptor
MKSLLRKKEAKKSMFFIIAIAMSLTLLHGQGQEKLSIKGQLKDQQNMQTVAFATVALRRTSDSTFITGVASNSEGEFSLENIAKGSYCIIISAIGYEHVTKTIYVTDIYDTGVIFLQPKTVTLGEVVVAGERVKAKAEADKTTFFMNKKMYDASDNGVEMLSYIPGIQVDIMKNISLEGSHHIVILVDGKERDRNFLSQLNASKIDKVEVINAPGSKYDADVTGVINIILKKDKVSGIDGHIHLEVPTSRSEIYVFPDYSFNYSSGKVNLYTSYDGDLSYFNILENSYRNFQDSRGITEFTSDQVVRQKYWSHRFHYGLDYNFNEKNQLNLYAFYNPYSSEHSGNVAMQINGEKFGDQNWSALKHDEDINYSTFYTLNYKHIFNNRAREISFDLSYFNFKAVNSTTFITTDSITDNFPAKQVNAVKPEQNSLSFKIDYTTPVTEKLKFDVGIKAKSQMLKDRQSDQFKYDESIFSIYGAIAYSFSKYTLNAGFRAERSTSALISSFNNSLFALLPNATINYKLTSNQNIKLSYNRIVNRPNIYELNPYTSSDDPYSVKSGNPDLKPEFQQNLSIDYSNNIGNNYISLRLFYLDRSDAINNYIFINDAGIFETRVANLGNIHGYGIQMAGALKFHKAIALNPFLKLTDIFTTCNNLAKQYDINSRHKMAFETGLSAIVTFKYDIVASLNFQYASPLIQIQTKSFSDALYIVSLDKTFNKKFKIGISSALPLSRTFTYQGSEISGANFYSHSDGNIRLSAVPLWLKFTYLFNSGKIFNRYTNNKEDIDNMPKKGF